MRVNAIRYLQTQGAWGGHVWRAHRHNNQMRIKRWWLSLLARRAEVIKKAMSFV